MATCPICKSAAEEIEQGFFDGKTFRCPKHNDFQVSDTVLSNPALMAAATNQWEAAILLVFVIISLATLVLLVGDQSFSKASIEMIGRLAP